MAQPQNSAQNNGYLIKNDKKNDRQPDYRGKVTIDGKEWNLAVWAKGQRDGKDFFSLVASDPATSPAPKGAQGQQTQHQGQAQQTQSGQQSQRQSTQQHAQQNTHQNQSSDNADHIVDDEFGSVFDGLP